jgi:hypothetical protein
MLTHASSNLIHTYRTHIVLFLAKSSASVTLCESESADIHQHKTLSLCLILQFLTTKAYFRNIFRHFRLNKYNNSLYFVKSEDVMTVNSLSGSDILESVRNFVMF